MVERQRVPFLIARKQDVVVVIAHRGVEVNKLYYDLSNGMERSNSQVAIGEPANSRIS